MTAVKALYCWTLGKCSLGGPKPYSCLPNQQRGGPSWKQSTRHSLKATINKALLEGKPTVQLNRNQGPKDQRKCFFYKVCSTTLRVMDVHTKNRGRPHQEMRFPAAPVVGRNFLAPGHPGARVRNVHGKSGPKGFCLCCFFFLRNLGFPEYRRSFYLS